MKFLEIRDLLEGIPFTTPQRGEELYNFILREKPKECLELGFAHGVASCYMAAALDELGEGRLTCVDLVIDEGRSPSLPELLKKTGLDEKVEVHIFREHTGYNWFLKKQIEQQTKIQITCSTLYDFCFIDGAKNWTIDGLAFFLVDKLLKEHGWILFDDLNWSYLLAGHSVCDGIAVDSLSEDEREEAHIDRIFRLLVMQHPNYSEFNITDSTWAWAHKVKSDSKSLTLTESSSLASSFMDMFRRGGLRCFKSLLKR